MVFLVGIIFFLSSFSSLFFVCNVLFVITELFICY